MKKYPIEKNTVQETLIIPLYGRKMCSEQFPQLFRDETAIRLIDQVDYDFSELAKKSKSAMQQFGFLEVAMRQNDLAWEVRDYLKAHPKAAVVNLGCGLDDTGRSCDNGCCRIYNLDFLSVIEVRDQLLPAGEREQNIGCDINDFSWFDKIDAADGAVFFAAGVFLLFPDRAGPGIGAGNGRALSGRTAGIRCRRQVGRQDDAQDMDKGREDTGCGRIFRGLGCGKGAFGLVAGHPGIEPRLHAGVSKP